jgi:hypothetical protein
MAHIVGHKEEPAHEPTWSDSLVDILKRSLFSSEEESDNILTPGDYSKKPSIQWSDIGDIGKNIGKGTWSRGIDYALKPWEMLSGRNLSADLAEYSATAPEYEDWDTEYRPEFEEGPYGWLRHLDKASHATGILGALGAYYGLSRVSPGLASTAYPSFRYLGDLMKMNKAMRIKKMLDTGVVPKGGIMNAVKDFAKFTGQTIGRPIRHLFQYKKRRKKEFDQFDPKTYTDKGTTLSGFPKSEKLFSLPERNLAKYSGIKYGTIAGLDVARSLVRDAKAAEIDTPRGIETVYQDPIMRMARTKDPGLEVTLPLPYTQ